jgi:serine protease DegQ
MVCCQTTCEIGKDEIVMSNYSTNKRLVPTLFVALSLASVTTVALAALPPAVDGVALPSLAPMLERTQPAVVNVSSRTRVQVRNPFFDDPFFERFFGGQGGQMGGRSQERVESSLGSGVIVDAAKGLVLTNNHVIENADEVSVTLTDGRVMPAELVGTDPDTDVALIKIKPERLTSLSLANSDALRVGDFVVAVGNPFGIGQSATSGIVSALGRSGLRGLGYQNFIQTDASINPGNSGGALVNLRGELVGINSAIFSPSGGNVGIGFAIPANLARNVMNQLLAFGEVQRGSLGVQTQDLTEALAKALKLDANQSQQRTLGGALVTQVLPDTAAARAGVREGDVITGIAGKTVHNAQELSNDEGLLPLATAHTLNVIRDGAPLVLKVTLVALSSQAVDGAKIDARLAGARLSDLTSAARSRGEGSTGVRISEVKPGTLAAKYGLLKNDLIAGVSRYQINNLAELAQVLKASAGRQVTLTIYRDRRSYVLTL